jgi:hypothetical protein
MVKATLLESQFPSLKGPGYAKAGWIRIQEQAEFQYVFVKFTLCRSSARKERVKEMKGRPKSLGNLCNTCLNGDSLNRNAL